MSDAMKAEDEFLCGSCGAQSLWRDSYYQTNTPDGPGASLPKAGYRDHSAWYSIEHYRAFCPKCGDLVADDGPSGMAWSGGARPIVEGRLPAQGGGNWILPLAAFTSCLVPRQSRTLDIEGLRRAEALVAAEEEQRRKAPIGDLIDKLRASKGRMAGDVEGELTARGSEAVPYLVAALKDPEVYLRWRTCYVLKAMGKQAEGAREALVEALQDEAESVRSGAEDALRSVGQPTAIGKTRKEAMIARFSAVVLALLVCGAPNVVAQTHSAVQPLAIGEKSATALRGHERKTPVLFDVEFDAGSKGFGKTLTPRTAFVLSVGEQRFPADYIAFHRLDQIPGWPGGPDDPPQVISVTDGLHCAFMFAGKARIGLLFDLPPEAATSTKKILELRFSEEGDPILVSVGK